MKDDQENLDKKEKAFQDQLVRAKVEDVVMKIMAFSDAEFNSLNIEKDIRKELETARALKTPVAKKRESRKVVGTILSEDFDELREDFLQLGSSKKSAEQRYSKIENLRDKILAGDSSAIEDAMATYPKCDRQHLRNLQRKARKEKSESAISKIGRTIFIYLKDLQN